MIRKRFLLSIALISTLLNLSPTLAQSPERELVNPNFNINLDLKTIEKGYTVAGFEDRIKLSLVPGILSDATNVDITQLQEKLTMPWSLDLISDVYQFEFKNKRAYDDHKPFYIQMSYNKRDNTYKQVFFYDKNFAAWRPLPTTDHPQAQFVRSLIHLPYARIAVFSFPEVLTVGKASWYAHKGGDFAASPDFPKGSRLRVSNLETGAFVDVEVNDYGPDRALFPDRAIDLDKTAFAKIAPLGEGVINVRVEPLRIAAGAGNSALQISAAGISDSPVLNSRAALIMNEDTGATLWSKNATTTMPLASLTKIIAAKIFLDQGISMDQVVAYRSADAEYNHEYCEPWESARLRASDGETMTVEDLFFTSLVGSANNTVETLVRVSGLSRPEFIKKMNEYVHSLGAVSTHLVEPTGLSPENVSSVRDYAIITKDALKNPLIAKASSIQEYKFTTINKQVPRTIKNTNHILRSNKFNITGSKTGYLDEALFCLMVRVKDAQGQNLIIVTFGTDTRTRSFDETTTLINFGSRL